LKKRSKKLLRVVDRMSVDGIVDILAIVGDSYPAGRAG